MKNTSGYFSISNAQNAKRGWKRRDIYVTDAEYLELMIELDRIRGMRGKK